MAKEPQTAKLLLEEIERWRIGRQLSATAFGILAVNDGHLVRDLRAGKDILASKVDRVRAFMAVYDTKLKGPSRAPETVSR